MHPVLIAAAAGLAGYFGWTEYEKKKKPVLQSLRKIDDKGTPVQVVVPVVATTPVNGKAVVPIPAGNTGTGANYAPKAVVASSSPGQLTLAPIVITPGGASTLAVQTNQDVQNALNTLGLASPALTIDGVIGPASKAAIIAFQAKTGLAQDGNVTAGLKAALQTALGSIAGTSQPVGTSPTVQGATSGSNGTVSAAVPVTVNTNVDVQHALNLLGASPALTEDGVLGPKSVAAIKAFQISHSLVADGVAGPKTKTALSIALNPSTVAAAGDYDPYHYRSHAGHDFHGGAPTKAMRILEHQEREVAAGINPADPFNPYDQPINPPDAGQYPDSPPPPDPPVANFTPAADGVVAPPPPIVEEVVVDEHSPNFWRGRHIPGHMFRFRGESSTPPPVMVTGPSQAIPRTKFG